MALLFKAEQKVVFIGDSITDAGHRDRYAPYGDGYVKMVRDFLIARYPELHLTIINKGVGGDTVRDLATRWERDVVAEKPDWVVVEVGINDVWRGYGPQPWDAVPLTEYNTTLRRLLERVRAVKSDTGIILMAPYFIEPERYNPMRQHMDRFRVVVRRIAADNSATYVPIQAAFDTALATTKPTDWTHDGIHPNSPGHALIALTFLKAIGFEL